MGARGWKTARRFARFRIKLIGKHCTIRDGPGHRIVTKKRWRDDGKGRGREEGEGGGENDESARGRGERLVS